MAVTAKGAAGEARRPPAWFARRALTMAASPGRARADDAQACAAALVASVAKSVVRFDALACLLPSGFDARSGHAPRQVAERVKRQSESLRLTLLMERASEEAAEVGAQLLASMRQLHQMGRTARLHPSHQTVLRLGLGLVEQIVQGLRELNPATLALEP